MANIKYGADEAKFAFQMLAHCERVGKPLVGRYREVVDAERERERREAWQRQCARARKTRFRFG